MFACLYGFSSRLVELAGQFSPLVETISAETVIFSIAGLDSLFGDSHQIASEISRRGAAMGVNAAVAIAVNPSVALVAARNLSGVTIIPPGQEAQVLAGISIKALPAPPEPLLTLDRWGIRTLGELGALPEIGLVERLGETGRQLRRLALGQSVDILHLQPPTPEYVARQEFEHSIELLEPLLFVISTQLHELTRQLQQTGRAARRIAVILSLDDDTQFIRTLDLPFAMRDPKALLKQIQLSLEARPPHAAILSVEVRLDPADPRVIQGGLFQPAAPEPEKLETLLARLRALAGANHVGSPEILNSHRPDAYRLRPCAFEPTEPRISNSSTLHLAMRYFRPAMAARVTLHNHLPRRIVSARVSGTVTQAAGPWRTSGEWWADTSWVRDEWDIALESGGIYRIYLTDKQWFLEGSYD